MGLAQTKLHHKVLQENWAGICRRLQTDDGKRWVRTKNPCGDYPLHLACYGGKAPPIIIRALIAAYPDALYIRNDLGFKPFQLAQSNYREGHPFREEVLEYLEAYSVDDGNEHRDGTDTNQDIVGYTKQNQQRILSIENGGETMPEITFMTSTVCVVCLERKADHVVVPCGHLCLCMGCAEKVIGTTIGKDGTYEKSRSAQRLCPVCRIAFTSIAKVQNQSIAVQNQSIAVA